MGPCSRDEAAERVAASAVTLAVLDVVPEDLHQLLLGSGSLRGLAAHERAIVSGHRRVLAWVNAEGYGDVVDGEIEGIASALALEEGVCDWEQLFSVFPDPWFLDEGDEGGGLILLEEDGVEIPKSPPAARGAGGRSSRGPVAGRGRSTRSLVAVT